jgi:AcrR family transcriptional regulator
MKKQAFSEIKVKDIILASGISSRTFYQYYKDIHALLLAVEDDILAEFNKALLADRSAVNGIDHVLSQGELITVAENISRNSISFFLKNKTKLEILTSDNGDIRFFNKMVEYANKEFAVRMEKMNPNYKAILAQEQSLPPEMVLGIFDINIINVVLQLIKYNDELSPADMRRYIAGYLTRTPLQFLGLMQ